MPIDFKETDEVYLALMTAKQAMERDGCNANPNISNCMKCYALYLIDNAIRVYAERQG